MHNNGISVQIMIGMEGTPCQPFAFELIVLSVCTLPRSKVDIESLDEDGDDDQHDHEQNDSQD